MKSLSRVQLLATQWTAAHQAPLSVGFSRQEYWSGLPLPSPILWLPDVKNCLIGKDPDAGRDWGQEETGTAEDEMAEWHHRLDGGESE